MLESMEPRDSSHLVPRYSRTFVRNAPKGQRKLSFRAADPPPPPAIRYERKWESSSVAPKYYFSMHKSIRLYRFKACALFVWKRLISRWKINSRKGNDRVHLAHWWFTIWDGSSMNFWFLIIPRCWKCWYQTRVWNIYV